MIILIFLIANQRIYSFTEAAKIQPEKEHVRSHDPLNSLLYRINIDREPLWKEAKKNTSF